MARPKKNQNPETRPLEEAKASGAQVTNSAPAEDRAAQIDQLAKAIRAQVRGYEELKAQLESLGCKVDYRIGLQIERPPQV